MIAPKAISLWTDVYTGVREKRGVGMGRGGVEWNRNIGEFHSREQIRPENVSESLTSKSLLKHCVPIW